MSPGGPSAEQWARGIALLIATLKANAVPLSADDMGQIAETAADFILNGD